MNRYQSTMTISAIFSSCAKRIVEAFKAFTVVSAACFPNSSPAADTASGIAAFVESANTEASRWLEYRRSAMSRYPDFARLVEASFFGPSKWSGCFPDDPCGLKKSAIHSFAIYFRAEGWYSSQKGPFMLFPEEENIEESYVRFLSSGEYSTDIPIVGLGERTEKVAYSKDLFGNDIKKQLGAFQKYSALVHCGPRGCLNEHFINIVFQDDRREQHYGVSVLCRSRGDEAIWSFPVNALLPPDGIFKFYRPERHAVQDLFINYEAEAPCADTSFSKTIQNMESIINEMQEFAFDAAMERIELLRSEGAFQR